MCNHPSPTLVAVQPDGTRRAYRLPLTPEAFHESVTPSSPGKPATHRVSFTFHLDVHLTDGRDSSTRPERGSLALLPDLAFIRLLPTAAHVVLEWGKRSLPARVEHIDIVEEAFDSTLAPIRARVEVTLVLLPDERVRALLAKWASLVGITGGRPGAQPGANAGHGSATGATVAAGAIGAASEAAARVRDALGRLRPPGR